MTTKAELEQLLATYETYIGTGNMKMAGRTLPKIIRTLVAFVESPKTAPVKKAVDPDQIDLEEVIAQSVATAQTCAPCDVSLPGNDKLLEEFRILAPSVQTTDTVGPPALKARPSVARRPAVSRAKNAPAPKTPAK